MEEIFAPLLTHPECKIGTCGEAAALLETASGPGEAKQPASRTVVVDPHQAFSIATQAFTFSSQQSVLFFSSMRAARNSCGTEPMCKHVQNFTLGHSYDQFRQDNMIT